MGLGCQSPKQFQPVRTSQIICHTVSNLVFYQGECHTATAWNTCVWFVGDPVCRPYLCLVCRRPTQWGRLLAAGVAAARACTAGMRAAGSASPFVHAAGFAGETEKAGNNSLAFVFCCVRGCCVDWEFIFAKKKENPVLHGVPSCSNRVQN